MFSFKQDLALEIEMDDSISNPLCDVNDDEIEVEDVEKEYKFVEPDKRKA